MKKFIFIIYLLFVIATKTFAQDVSFINTNQSLVYLNPSFAGSNGGLRVQSNYQNKWPNNNEGRTSVNWQNAADIYVKKWKGSFAVNCMNSNYGNGLIKTNNIGLTYARHFLVNKVKIIPSVQMGYIQRRLDVSNISYVNIVQLGFIPEFPPNFRGDKVQKQAVDFSSGILIQCENFYAGISAFHLNQPDIGFMNIEKLPVILNFHTSYNFILSEKTLIQVSQKFTLQKNDGSLQLNVNAVFFKHFICGLGFGGATYAANPYYYGKNSYNYSPTSYNVIMNLGYRSNYFSATLFNGTGFDKKGLDYRNIWELALSYNLRNKENRKKLTAFEAW